VRDLKRVGRQPGALAKEADEAELADSGGARELVEGDVALRSLGQVLAGAT
jgi:hypothetical protein